MHVCVCLRMTGECQGRTDWAVLNTSSIPRRLLHLHLSRSLHVPGRCNVFNVRTNHLETVVEQASRWGDRQRRACSRPEPETGMRDISYAVSDDVTLMYNVSERKKMKNVSAFHKKTIVAFIATQKLNDLLLLGENSNAFLLAVQRIRSHIVSSYRTPRDLKL